jgi:hypothetical protein
LCRRYGSWRKPPSCAYRLRGAAWPTLVDAASRPNDPQTLQEHCEAACCGFRREAPGTSRITFCALAPESPRTHWLPPKQVPLASACLILGRCCGVHP